MALNTTVLVVGASSGIGRETALVFARAGAKVMAAARREDRLRDLQTAAARENLRIEMAVADASSGGAMQQLARDANAALGSVEALIYAAGTNTPDRAMSRMNAKLWDEIVAVNLNGAYYITSALLPAMRERRRGDLIYVSSISGLMADVSGAAYQASKRGLVALAHAIRAEEKENGIRTCALCPGLVDTEILDKRPIKPAPELLAKALRAEDVAQLALAIVSLPPRATVPEVQILPTVL